MMRSREQVDAISLLILFAKQKIRSRRPPPPPLISSRIEQPVAGSRAGHCQPRFEPCGIHSPARISNRILSLKCHRIVRIFLNRFHYQRATYLSSISVSDREARYQMMTIFRSLALSLSEKRERMKETRTQHCARPIMSSHTSSRSNTIFSVEKSLLKENVFIFSRFELLELKE